MTKCGTREITTCLRLEYSAISSWKFKFPGIENSVIDNRVLNCDVIIFANFTVRIFKPHHEIYTAAVRTWSEFQIASINESKDREV